MVGDNNLFSTPKHKNQQGNIDFNSTLEQMILADIFRTFQTNVVECSFFSILHRTFSRMDYKIKHKTSQQIQEN